MIKPLVQRSGNSHNFVIILGIQTLNKDEIVASYEVISLEPKVRIDEILEPQAPW